jgi:hypothetical protein
LDWCLLSEGNILQMQPRCLVLRSMWSTVAAAHIGKAPGREPLSKLANAYQMLRTRPWMNQFDRSQHNVPDKEHVYWMTLAISQGNPRLAKNMQFDQLAKMFRLPKYCCSYSISTRWNKRLGWYQTESHAVHAATVENGGDCVGQLVGHLTAHYVLV